MKAAKEKIELDAKSICSGDKGDRCGFQVGPVRPYRSPTHCLSGHKGLPEAGPVGL